MYVHIHKCRHIHKYTCILHKHACVCDVCVMCAMANAYALYTYIYTYIHICIYVYIYVYIYICIHTYIYIYTVDLNSLLAVGHCGLKFVQSVAVLCRRSPELWYLPCGVVQCVAVCRSTV